ncbi:MAG: aminotransferase class V-fold PLP-dependent enzyme, partial [bacterium]
MADQNPYRSLVIGVDREIPLRDGNTIKYINFDNAASTPALKAAQSASEHLMEVYASIHRGAGYKSQLSSEWYDLSRDVAMEFVRADPDVHCAVFTGNTTDSINRFARMLPRDNDRSVVISQVEHHANDLPWRERGRTVRTQVTDDGLIDPDALDHTLKVEGKRARLVSLTGASNVVGTLQPIEELTTVAHKHGVPILIDAAQLAPHKPISMKLKNRELIDFLVLSGHKMYAPFGGGLLIGRKDVMSESAPALRGGGAVLVVEPDAVDWAPPPEREEAGSPNVLGAITLATAMKALRKIGFEALDEIEQRLTRKFIAGLKKIGAIVYGLSEERDLRRRLGVIAFNIPNVPHDLVAAILSGEGGIGVRNGCFCAHPFVIQMLHVGPEQAEMHRDRLRQGDKTDVPGAVRIYFGFYNTEEEVDRALEWLEKISDGCCKDRYRQN